MNYKSLFVISILLIIFSIILLLFQRQPKETPPNEIMRITLTDTNRGNADEMVSHFRKDSTCQEQKTSFWIDASWINNVYSIITSERGDGIRVYFAKSSRKQNTIVLVSTFRIGTDNRTYCESGADHQDYFEHTNPFFNSPDRKLTRDSASDPGALLFKDTCNCGAEHGKTNRVSPGDINCGDAYRAVQNVVKGDSINIRSEWFSLKTIGTLKAALDSQTMKHPEAPGDGVRIYFAKHTIKTQTQQSSNPQHPGKFAVIFICTKKIDINGKSYHQDFFYKFDKNKNKDQFIAYRMTVSSDGGGDNGEQCLYNCTGTTLPSQ